MAGERTEKATPKRRQKARSQGQLAKSQDFTAAVLLTVSLCLLYAYIPFIFDRMQFATSYTFTHLDPTQITKESFWSYLIPYLHLLAVILLPILLVLFASAVGVSYFQVGPMFTLETIKPKFEKLNPASMITGFKKFFNLRSLVELIKSLIKMIIVAGISYAVIKSRLPDILNLLGADTMQSLSVIGSIIFQIMLLTCIILIILGILDFKYQNYEFEKSIKMTKEDVKDERKNTEGDPKVKARIKGIQMKFAQQRMMSAVPTADVIVTNPTHISIALKYDSKDTPIPKVIAKGADFVAFRIREIAKNNNIPIVENKPLARTLYKVVPVDGFIPAELYVAVAEVLAYVYRLNKGKIK